MGSTSQTVFEDAFTETGRLRIYRDPDGELAMVVTGTIGKEDAAAVGRLISPSFVETYRNLHGGQLEVPAELLALEKQRAPIRIRSGSVKPPPQELPLGAESKAAFLSAACQTFPDGASFSQIPQACQWFGNISALSAGTEIYPSFGDWSFFWNMTSVLGYHGLVISGGTILKHSMPANSWGYHVWPGSIGSGVPVIANSLGITCEYGVTAHWRFPN